jgi:hypothetical protein
MNMITGDTTSLMNEVKQDLNMSVGIIPGIGSTLVGYIECMLPISTSTFFFLFAYFFDIFHFKDVQYVLDIIDLVEDVAEDIVDFQVTIPPFMFPNMAILATNFVSASVTYVVQSTQASLKKYPFECSFSFYIL